jgi:hypothetical protein
LDQDICSPGHGSQEEIPGEQTVEEIVIEKADEYSIFKVVNWYFIIHNHSFER